MSEKKKNQVAASGSGAKTGKERGAKAARKDDQVPAKPKDGDLSSHVSSLNDWEHADLGDDSRKNKFLRLMGAAKANSGKDAEPEPKPAKKFVTDARKVEVELEEQFKEGLEHTLVSGHKGHVGLGFHDPSAAAAEPKPPQNKVTKFDDDGGAIVVGIPNSDIAGPNRAEEYSDEDSGDGSAASDKPEKARGKRSGKRSKQKSCAESRRDDEVEDEKKELSDEDAPAAAAVHKKAKRSAVTAGRGNDVGKVKDKPAGSSASVKKSSKMPAGFVKAVDA